MPHRILIVEDDAKFRDSLCDILNLEGFTAYGVGSIAAYQTWSKNNDCDVLILDRNLPDGDGLSVLTIQKQKRSVPTIFVTCEGESEDRVLGLNSDADYYLVKPIVTNELVAILKRIERRIGSDERNLPNWLIDRNRWRLIWPESRYFIPLTRSEMVIMSCFIQKTGIHIGRDDIARALGHNPMAYDFRRLEVMVRRLRAKASNASGADIPLHTTYGTGYVFNEPIAELLDD